MDNTFFKLKGKIGAMHLIQVLRYLPFWMLMFWSTTSFGQDSARYRTLSPEEFLNIVRTYHPVAKQAGLMVDYARSQLLASRGMFDPSVYFSSDEKTFDGKNYYNHTNLALKIPTWFGVEIMAGLENNGGDFLNSEYTSGKSSYAGLSVPLAKNLVMDKRRAALKQGKIFVDQSKAEQQLMVNDLLFEAIGSYWEWVQQYNVYRILTDAVTINEKRYQALRITVEQGDRPGVDSAEALTQLLTFRMLQTQAYASFLNAGYDMSNYLWAPGNTPYVIDSTVLPSVDTDKADPFAMKYQPLPDLLQTAQVAHPKLQSFNFKLDALEIERQLKFQSLLPTVNLKYNALAKGYEFWDGWTPPSMNNNYKFGVDIGLPLFLRQGRGEYQGAKIKIASTEYDQSQTGLSISNKVREYYTNMTNLLQQIRISEQALKAYQKVFEVELMKFEIGESSLFLVNSRENKVLEARQKLTELKAKFFKSLYGVQWSTGTLQ